MDEKVAIVVVQYNTLEKREDKMLRHYDMETSDANRLKENWKDQIKLNRKMTHIDTE